MPILLLLGFGLVVAGLMMTKKEEISEDTLRAVSLTIIKGLKTQLDGIPRTTPAELEQVKWVIEKNPEQLKAFGDRNPALRQEAILLMKKLTEKSQSEGIA